MKEVHIDQVIPDSLLADDLKNSVGSMILRRGTKLTEAMLNRLRKMEIVMLVVDGNDAEQLIAEREELLAALELRFAGTEENEFLQELKTIAIEHLTV